jgi:hypothetical protein
MIAEVDAPLSPVDQLDRAFNDVAEIYQELWLVRQVDMPDDILSESFARFTARISVLNRIAQEQASQHERDARTRAREERVRLAAVEQAAAAAPPPPPQPQPVILEVTLINHTPAPAQAPRINRQVRQKRRPARKSVALKKSELDAMMTDACCICMDEYTRVNSVTTSCEHAFCKGCYNAHEQSGLSKRMPKVCCPICRAENPKITEYRARRVKIAVAPGVVTLPLTPLLREEPMAHPNPIIVGDS